MAITLVGAAVAAACGILLAGFGLSWIALLVALAAIAVALLLRQALLPVGVVTSALALSAAAVTLMQTPIDRSAGLLTVTPTTPDQVDSRHLRRGAGSVFVDLRRLKAAPGQTVHVRASSAMGMVVVALPHDRCFNLKIRARQPHGAVSDPFRSILRTVGVEIDAGDVPIVNQFEPVDANGTINNSPLVAFGRAPVTRFQNGFSSSSYTRVVSPSRPTLDLDLTGHGSSVVRDFPDWVGPMTPPFMFGEQVGDVTWPLSVRMPRNPGDLSLADAWHRTWTKAQVARRVPARWAAWERRTIRAQRAQAVRAAGPCATRGQLAQTWSSTPFGDFAEAGIHPEYDAFGDPIPPQDPAMAGDADGQSRIYYISVNGLGAVRRVEVDQSGNVAPSTMTAANPKGIR